MEKQPPASPQPTSQAIVPSKSAKARARKKKNKMALGKEKRPSLDDYDDAALDNIILRIKLPQAVKILFPVAIFVVTNHVFIYLEILD